MKTELLLFIVYVATKVNIYIYMIKLTILLKMCLFFITRQHVVYHYTWKEIAIKRYSIRWSNDKKTLELAVSNMCKKVPCLSSTTMSLTGAQVQSCSQRKSCIADLSILKT